MVFALGVVLFALGIGVSIALHEFGHLLTAKAFGMKVRRYFIGFGPKVWSFRRGETEYGLKAIPAGGFCDIAGTTAMDELEPDEVGRAMFKQSTWKRVTVMFGGVFTNFVLGLVIIYALALGWGLPDLNPTPFVQVQKTECVPAHQSADGTLSPCQGTGPAGRSGVRAGDVITGVNGHQVSTGADLAKAIQQSSGTVTLQITRDGKPLSLPVQPQQVQRYEKGTNGSPTSTQQGAIGVLMSTQIPPWEQYNAFSAVPAAFSFTGGLGVKSWDALLQFPERIPALVQSIGGGQRSADTPMSVVGASRVGGQLAEHDAWASFLLLLAELNLFLGLINLLPLLPFDGGHIAVALYEKLRNVVRRAFGRSAGAPVDYMKLMPVTLVVAIVLGGIMLLTVTADIVNPIRLF